MSTKAKKSSDSKEHTKDIWFPAKKFGYGWGVPVKWQGWAVLVGCLGIGLAPLVYLSVWYKGDSYCRSVIDQGITVNCNPNAETGVYYMAALFWLVALILLLTHICTIKGEPAKWRWSGSGKHAKKS